MKNSKETSERLALKNFGSLIIVSNQRGTIVFNNNKVGRDFLQNRLRNYLTTCRLPLIRMWCPGKVQT